VHDKKFDSRRFEAVVEYRLKIIWRGFSIGSSGMNSNNPNRIEPWLVVSTHDQGPQNMGGDRWG
jgi:hypothetical protein